MHQGALRRLRRAFTSLISFRYDGSCDVPARKD